MLLSRLKRFKESPDSTNVSARGLRAFACEQQGRWDDAATAWAACVSAGDMVPSQLS